VIRSRTTRVSPSWRSEIVKLTKLKQGEEDDEDDEEEEEEEEFPPMYALARATLL